VAVGNDAPALFPLGTTTVTWTATDDAGNAATGTQQVTVVDTTPPVLTVPVDVTAEATSPAGTAVAIGQAIAIDLGDPDVAVSNDAPLLFPLGTTMVIWMATDAAENTAVAVQRVTVVDTAAPQITSIGASPNQLWPPNHQMVDVEVTVHATDLGDAAPVARILGVTSSEPINGLGDGDTAPDWVITGALTLKLRAERSAKGTGRIYTITVACTDAAGNHSAMTVTVSVPRNHRGQ
jgi:hypothetical protein